MTLHDTFDLQPQAEWWWYIANRAAHGEPRERQRAIRYLADMARNHEDDRLRSRADSLVSLRGWGNVAVLTPGGNEA